MFQILPSFVNQAYDYFYNNQQQTEVTDQLGNQESPSEESPAVATAVTDVRTGTNFTSMSFTQLIELVKTEEMTKVSGALKDLKQKMQQSGDRLKAIDEALAQLADIGTEDTTIVVSEKPELKQAFDKLSAIGITSTLLQKTELSKNDRSSLAIFLQHKRSTEQEDIKAGRQEFQEHFERRNTLYETLMSVLSTIKQSIDRIFAKG